MKIANGNLKQLIYDAVGAVSMNMMRLAISAALVLLLPKFMGIYGYSSWQQYLFYTSYAVFSSLGVCEGLYIEYGGADYDSLDRSEISGQLRLLSLFVILIAACAWILTAALNVTWVLLAFAFTSAALDIQRYAIQCVLQATGRIKAYIRIQGFERILFFAFAMICILLGKLEYYHIIASEIAARLLSLIFAMYYCRGFFICKPPSVKNILTRAKSLVQTGFKLQCATFFGQLSTGAALFAVLSRWGDANFGGISLAFSLANIGVSCAMGVGVAFYPYIKRSDDMALKRLYPVVRIGAFLPAMMLMMMYPLIKGVLEEWLPKYIQSLHYLAILMPVCIFESRTALLTDIYFKACKRTGRVLFINFIAVCVGVLSAYLAVSLTENIEIVVVAAVITSAFKSIFSEYLLRDYTDFSPLPDICMELFISAGFLLSFLHLNDMTSALCNIAIVILYLIVKRRSLCEAGREAKALAGGGLK